MLEDLGVYHETFYLEAESVRMKNESVGRLRNIECLLSDLSRKRDELREKDEEIRLAHETVVDLKGQIRVVVRVRPLIDKELETHVNHLSYPGISSIKLVLSAWIQCFNNSIWADRQLKNVHDEM
ncbi:hypothetical protein DICVIV_14336, partial [Dictyocaulus viviparus]